MSDSRYVIGRWVATVLMVVLGSVTVVGLLTSSAGIPGKVLGTLMVGLLLGGAGIRVWMASRPYGRGDRD